MDMIHKDRMVLVGIVAIMAMAVAAFAIFGVSQGNAASDSDITLTPGWNLIGWPGSATPIGQELDSAGIAGRVTAVWGYSEAGGWQAFFPAQAGVPGLNNLSTFQHLSGYFVALSGTGNVTWDTSTSLASSPTVTPTTGAPTATPTQPPAAVHTIGNGTFLVGADIVPGTYRTRTGSDGCYWERLSGLGGTLDDIIANNLTNAPDVVTIAPTDKAFSSEDCATWTTDLSAITANPNGPITTDGTFIVGTDVAPGTWRTSGGDGCYWARLSGFSGSLGDIISNDLPTGSAIVTISPSDVGFQTQSCGTWTKVG